MELCLDSLTLTDTDPVALIYAADSAGFDLVSLWVQPPPIFPLQLVTPDKEKACLAALAETGVGVGQLEVFALVSSAVIKSFRPALELGARLGAKTALAINVIPAEPAKVGELLAEFADLAAEYGLSVNLEPIAMFPIATLAEAREVIRASGTDAGIVLDAFHLIRKGGTVADIKAIEPGLIRHIQLCDGVAHVSEEVMHYEASYERLYPGDGVFPLVEMLNSSPVGVTIGIEAPSKQRHAEGLTAELQAKEAMRAMRKIINQIPETQRRQD